MMFYFNFSLSSIIIISELFQNLFITKDMKEHGFHIPDLEIEKFKAND